MANKNKAEAAKAAEAKIKAARAWRAARRDGETFAAYMQRMLEAQSGGTKRPGGGRW